MLDKDINAYTWKDVAEEKIADAIYKVLRRGEN